MTGDLAARLGVRVVRHGGIDSTMSAALADSGPLPALHLAESQSAGRGRRGRVWESPPGNLYATFRWPEPEPRFPPGLLGAVQLEWARAIQAAGGPAVRCKWPNDGWLDGAKWAGVLAVRPASRPGELHLGMGANLVTAPPDVVDPPATGLRKGWAGWPGAASVREMLLLAALRVLAGGPEGIAPRLAEWARYDALDPGEPVVVEVPQGTRTMTYRGVDRDGRLCVAAGEVVSRLVSGEVRRVRQP